MVLTPPQIKAREDYALEQNRTTLMNRVNELGVSEPIVQRQGLDRINVQLPGVQNSAEVKDLLGKVATLEFRLVNTQDSPLQAQQSGHAPIGSKLYKRKDGTPILLKREVVVTGDELTQATSTTSQEGPAVSIKLDARGAESMQRTTRLNVGKPLAVVFIEKSRHAVEVNGQKVERNVTTETVINVATIRGVFGPQFEVTGLAIGEARDLSLLLRSGSLAAPVDVVEERAIGPSLGQENIDKGVRALEIGMLAVFVFMAVYYHAFGLVADAVLLANVVLLTALLSLLRASLSLPGIAGIILTVGIAVDANVLIYERIREELRIGVSPQAAIRAGFGDCRLERHRADRRPRVMGHRHRRNPRVRDRLDIGDRHLDVHLAAGQPRIDLAHVRGPRQSRAALDRLKAGTRITTWSFFIAPPASRSCPPARCGTDSRSY